MVADDIRKIREAAGLSRADLAWKAGLSETTLAAAEDGRGDIGSGFAAAIADAAQRPNYVPCAEREITVRMAPDEAVAQLFSLYDDVAAVYRMPEPYKFGSRRYAVVDAGSSLDTNVRMLADVHFLELFAGRLVDLLHFYPYCRPLNDDDLVYLAPGARLPDDTVFIPPSEEDPMNRSKIERIQRFGTAARSTPSLVDDVCDRIGPRGREWVNGPAIPQQLDWTAYLELYPHGQLCDFLENGNVHLQTICASSPLQYRSAGEA